MQAVRWSPHLNLASNQSTAKNNVVNFAALVARRAEKLVPVSAVLPAAA